jgi:hypothetical protein
VMDPYVVEALMEYTGPIDVPELDVTVEPADAAEFILRDQYTLALTDQDGLDNANRVEALDSMAEQVITRLVTGRIPPVTQVVGALAPLVEERRLLFWTTNPDERALLEEAGLLGDLPDLSQSGGFSVSVNNASASKIDVFLERDVDVSVETDDDGSRRLVADVTLRNAAPSSGLPRYLIGNSIGQPDGTSRLFVTFYGPPELVSATLDGEPIAVEPSREAGWAAFGHVVTLSSGETAQYHLAFDLPPAGGDGEADVPTRFEQPLASR